MQTIYQAGNYSVQAFNNGFALLITRNEGKEGVYSCLLQGEEAADLEEALDCAENKLVGRDILAEYDPVMTLETPTQLAA